MATGYEVRMYQDISRIAKALERIAAALEKQEDCVAVGFSGEGRCIEPATAGQYCASHASKEKT